MSALRVELAALEDLVERLAAFEAYAEVSATEVERQVAALHAQWTGRAAERHREAHDSWRTGATRMRAAVAELRESVTGARANYAAAVRAGAQMWGELP